MNVVDDHRRIIKHVLNSVALVLIRDHVSEEDMLVVVEEVHSCILEDAIAHHKMIKVGVEVQ